MTTYKSLRLRFILIKFNTWITWCEKFDRSNEANSTNLHPPKILTVSPDASKVELFPINVCHHPSSSWLIYKALKETPYYPFKGYVRHVRNDNYSSRFVKSKFVCFCFVLFVCLVVFPIFFCCFCFHLLDKSNLL
jgi:hypothetical protein